MGVRAFVYAVSLVLAGCAALPPFPAEPEYGSRFYGFAQPQGEGPFPVAVLLHTCGGIGPHVLNWAGFLRARGYASVIVDSFRPRGSNRCTIPTHFPASVDEVAGDAIAAIEHLRTRPRIDPARIVVIGFSWGGNAALRLSSAGFRTGRGKPAAVVSFYPMCIPFVGALPDAAARADNLRADADIPSLVIIGEDDNDTPSVVANCRSRVETLRAAGKPVSIEVIPDAGHNFDAHGGAATRAAEGRLIEFLRRHAPPVK
jgi:dienelactone hydrolase